MLTASQRVKLMTAVAPSPAALLAHSLCRVREKRTMREENFVPCLVLIVFLAFPRIALVLLYLFSTYLVVANIIDGGGGRISLVCSAYRSVQQAQTRPSRPLSLKELESSHVTTSRVSDE
jgi:hypothetical protein